MKCHVRINRPSLFIIAMIMVFVGATSTRAELIEGFESGVLISDSAIGDASINSPNFFGILPTEGNHHLVLSTINSISDPKYSPISGTTAVSVTAIANFLGVPTSSIRNGLVTGQEGSAFRLELGSLNVGDVITFDYNFLTNEVQPGAHSDFAFITLTGLSGNTPVVADTFSLLTPTTGGGNLFALETHYQTYSITIAKPGNYTLGIGVVDGTTSDVPSALLIDNIQFIPIPEPSILALEMLGVALFAALGCRLKTPEA